MAKLNLIEYLKCRSKISLKSLSLKSTINSLLDGFTQSATSFITNLQGQAGAIGDQISGSVKNAEDALKALKANLENRFKIEKKFLVNIPNPLGFLETSCPEVSENTPKTPKVNPVKEALVAPLSQDPAVLKASVDMQDRKNVVDSKSNSTSPLMETAKVTGNIHNNFVKKSIQDIRAWVHHLRNQHPLVDSYVKTLKYFQPMSESVGASFLAYTPDKSTLDLKHWANPTEFQKVVAVRNNIKNKVNVDSLSTIENSYVDLTKRLASNISTETIYAEGNIVLRNLAHAQHLAGDVLWIENHVGASDWTSNITNAITKTNPDFKDTIGLVDYLVPIKESLEVENNTYVVKNEGQTFEVDNRNNIVQSSPEQVNNSALEPTKELEA